MKLQPASVDPKSEPMKLLGREAACKQIEEVAVSNCTQRHSTDHATFSFLIATGHVRSGKTRMGIETPRMVEQACKTNESVSGLNILKPVYLKIDFLNGCKFDKSFDTPDTSASVALGARLMYAFHGTPPDMKENGPSLRDISDEKAFQYIISRMLQDTTEDSIVPIVCHFDEHGDFIKHIDDAAPNEDESAGRHHFVQMLRRIGAIVTSSDSPLRKALKGRYFIVSIITGTSKKEANIGGINKYLVRQLPLPALDLNDSKDLARQFFLISHQTADLERIDEELEKLTFQIGLADTGGLPGLIGMVCQGGLLSSGAYSLRLHDNVTTYMDGVSWSNRWSVLVSICLARPTVTESTIIEKYSKVTANGNTTEESYSVSDARDSGTLLFDNEEIGISACLFRRFNNMQGNTQFVNPLLLKHISIAEQWTWQDFEQAHGLYLGAVIAALIKTKDIFFEKVTLGNLLKYAQPRRNAHLSRTLELPPRFDGINLKKAKNQSIPKATGKRKRHSVDLKAKEEVMLAADGTPIIDAHLNLTLSKADDSTQNVDVILFIQYKHKKLNSKTQVKVSEMDAAVELLASRLKGSEWGGHEWLFLWVSNREVEMDMDSPDHRLLWVGRKDLVKHAPLIGCRGLVTKEIDRSGE